MPNQIVHGDEDGMATCGFTVLQEQHTWLTSSSTDMTDAHRTQPQSSHRILLDDLRVVSTADAVAVAVGVGVGVA